MAGYSRLMGRTRRAPRTAPGHLRALIEPKIAECRDRVVKNSGDGSMAEFASVVDAVPSAVEMQRGWGSATRCRGLCEEFNVIAGVKWIEAQICSCGDKLADPYLDQETSVLDAVLQRAKNDSVDLVMVAGEVV